MTLCPYCKNSVNNDAKVCGYCGKDFIKIDRKAFTKTFVKALAIILILYGVLGMSASGVGIWSIKTYGLNLNIVNIGGFGDLATKFDDASSTANHLATTMDGASTSAKQASSVVRDNLILSLSSMADALDHWYTRWIGGVSDAVNNARVFARNSYQLADNFNSMSDSLSQNAQDMRKMSGQLKDISNNLNSRSGALQIPPQVNLIIIGLLIWLLILHFMFFGIGLCLFWIKT